MQTQNDRVKKNESNFYFWHIHSKAGGVGCWQFMYCVKNFINLFTVNIIQKPFKCELWMLFDEIEMQMTRLHRLEFDVLVIDW